MKQDQGQKWSAWKDFGLCPAYKWSKKLLDKYKLCLNYPKQNCGSKYLSLKNILSQKILVSPPSLRHRVK